MASMAVRRRARRSSAACDARPRRSGDSNAVAKVSPYRLPSWRRQLFQLLTGELDFATDPRGQLACLVVFVFHAHQSFCELTDMSETLSQFLPLDGHAMADSSTFSSLLPVKDDSSERSVV